MLKKLNLFLPGKILPGGFFKEWVRVRGLKICPKNFLDVANLANFKNHCSIYLNPSNY